MGPWLTKSWQSPREETNLEPGRRGSAIQSKWEEIQRTLAWLPSAEVVTEMLTRAGAESSPESLGLPDEWVKDALTYARHLRSRYTVMDLAAELGI